MQSSSNRKKLKITLILAANKRDPLVGRNPFMPLSLPILASVAPEHEYEFIDMLDEPEKIDFTTTSDIIGISLRQSAESTALMLADNFRSKGKTVVLGGAQASADPYKCKKHANSVVVGEAEQLWPILLTDFQNDELKDYYVCSPVSFDSKGHSVIQLDELPPLQSLPIPARNIFKRKYKFDMTFASRGCPISCDFCLVSDIFGKKLRMKPVEDVVEDIKQFTGFYYLLDDTVFGRPDCYDYYLELYERIAELKRHNYWTGQANLDAASSEKGRMVIKKAARSGLVYASIGIESINYATLKRNGALSKSGASGAEDVIQKLKENIAFIQDQGIIISGWFTLGYEEDTVQTFYNTLDFCLETNILPVLSPIRALPASRLYNRIKAEGKLQSADTSISNISNELLTDKDILTALTTIAKRAYSTKNNRKRLAFYYRKFRKSEQSLNDAIYKTIFAYVTQKRMRSIVFAENKFLSDKIGKGF